MAHTNKFPLHCVVQTMSGWCTLKGKKLKGIQVYHTAEGNSIMEQAWQLLKNGKKTKIRMLMLSTIDDQFFFSPVDWQRFHW